MARTGRQRLAEERERGEWKEWELQEGRRRPIEVKDNGDVEDAAIEEEEGMLISELDSRTENQREGACQSVSLCVCV